MSVSAVQGEVVSERATMLFHRYMDENYAKTSRVFAILMVAQWAFAVLIAVLWSPYGWEGKTQSIHVHVPAAIFLGGAISGLPLFLALTRPSSLLTRMVVACAQMLWSSLLIHLTGGRIETHFHIFGSLAFIAFYRDWRVLVPATVLVAGDHLARGIFWPESVYGILNPEWWRFLEHAFWVVFEDIILAAACVRGVDEVRKLALRQAEAEVSSESERGKAAQLSLAMQQLESSHEALTRTEKLAAVGQLAASVGHELRNPLGAVRNALAYVSKRVMDPAVAGEALTQDKRMGRFFEVMEKELNECNRIISDLLDFARDRKPELRPSPLRALVKEALGIVPPRKNVTVRNEVPEELPVPELDKDQFRQVIVNLVQNASEAIPEGREGNVTVAAQGGGSTPWRITITDDGEGIPKELQEKILQPLFTTKTKGTGLGLPIVAGIVARHQGELKVESEPGRGTTFVIQLPAAAGAQAASA